VDAREPPSQLQETLKKSTKVDAEYNLPTWVLKTKVNIQGIFREHSVNIPGTFKEHSGNIQGPLREHSGNIQGPFREH
jgi:hypothetical protein